MTYLPSPQPADDDRDATAAAHPVRRGRRVTPKPARTSGRVAAIEDAPAARPNAAQRRAAARVQAAEAERTASHADVVAYMETVELDARLAPSDARARRGRPHLAPASATPGAVQRMLSPIFAAVPLPLGSFAMAIVLAGASLGLTGCNESHATAPPAPPVVTVAKAESKPVTEWDEFTGRTEAVEAVEVKPRISGHITEVKFRAGQMVKKGDVLFVIDPRPYQVIVDQRQADVERAKIRQANAERMAQRANKLANGRVISVEAEDTLVTAFSEARSALASAEALLDAAKLDLEFTSIRSPIDGRVSRALLTVGNYVSTTAKAGEPSLLTTIVSVDPIYVHVDIDEQTLIKLKALEAASRSEAAPGNDSKRTTTLSDGTAMEEKIPVEMALTSQEGFPYKGWVESIDNRLDANTSTILLRVVIPNSDGKLVPGLFTRVRVPTTDSRETVLVADTAVGTDQAQKFVYTVGDGNIVEYRGVTLGPVVDGKRVIRTGLKAGERVVVNGIQRARPKMEVNPQAPAVQTAQNTAPAHVPSKN
ncbi:efflux transporter periplasmic adaptor subunit [Verrucomicrobia bacterium LW23]|nr:efflux transporter periplasmic adaptor subunit [Verrucomicrobia bacterium LW23]